MKSRRQSRTWWATAVFAAILKDRLRLAQLDFNPPKGASRMRLGATKRKLKGERRKAVDTAANYFLSNKDSMKYDEYIAAGLPIPPTGSSSPSSESRSVTCSKSAPKTGHRRRVHRGIPQLRDLQRTAACQISEAEKLVDGQPGETDELAKDATSQLRVLRDAQRRHSTRLPHHDVTASRASLCPPRLLESPDRLLSRDSGKVGQAATSINSTS